MKRSTLRLFVFLFGAFVGLALLAAHWFYRIPPKTENPEGETSGAIRAEDLVSAGVRAGDIPSIDSPAFESVAEADQYLKDAGLGLDVETNGAHRFYPYQILVWHEIVNDTFGVEPIAVTYDPLTLTGTVFSRLVNGEPLTFESSGELWNDNLIMQDREHGTNWSQLLGTSLDGSQMLARYPAATTTWANWKVAYPRGEVLSRETGFSRDYTRDPYGNYQESPAVWFPLTHYDSRLGAKTRVYGVWVGNDHAAYPVESLARLGTLDDVVNGTPITVEYDAELETARAVHVGMDGVAEPLPVALSFWFAWAAAFPDTQLHE